jgi:hypothetical protein
LAAIIRFGRHCGTKVHALEQSSLKRDDAQDPLRGR